VALLVNGHRLAGYYEVTFRPENLPGGVYYYRLQANDFAGTRKLVFVK